MKQVGRRGDFPNERLLQMFIALQFPEGVCELYAHTMSVIRVRDARTSALTGSIVMECSLITTRGYLEVAVTMGADVNVIEEATGVLLRVDDAIVGGRASTIVFSMSREWGHDCDRRKTFRQFVLFLNDMTFWLMRRPLTPTLSSPYTTRSESTLSQFISR